MRLERCPAEDWAAKTAGLAGASLLQTPAYMQAKVMSGVWRGELHTIENADTVRGAVVALIRDLPLGLGGLAWINRGPLYGAREDLGALVDAVAAHYTARGYYTRIAPPSEDAVSCSMTVTSGRGWASSRLDLTPDEAALRAGLKGSWRRFLKKGEGAGLTFSRRDDAEGFGIFLADYAGFLEHRAIATTVTPDLLQALWSLAPSPVYLVEKDGVLLATLLTATYGDTFEFLAGNTTEEGRKLNAGQVLFWRAMLDMKENGFKTFDVGGLDPDITPGGIRRFKEGLGGVPYRLTPALEAFPRGLKGLTARLVKAKVEGASV